MGIPEPISKSTDWVKLMLDGLPQAENDEMPNLSASISDRVYLYIAVSRTPVREAIRKLAEYGLVLIKPRSCAYVATISPGEAKDISWVRLYLERLSVRQFTEVASAEALVPLRKLSRQCQEANRNGDYAAAHEFDSTLHLEIARATGNGELLEMLQMLDAKLQLLRLKQHLHHSALSSYFSQHDLLLDLLERKDLASIDALLEEHMMHDLNFK